MLNDGTRLLGGFGERTLFKFEDAKVTSFYFMPVKSYVEFGQKFTQLVVAFLSDKSIVVSTVYGTEVARTKIEENPIEFTTSVSGEERFFGVLTDTG